MENATINEHIAQVLCDHIFSDEVPWKKGQYVNRVDVKDLSELQRSIFDAFRNTKDINGNFVVLPSPDSGSGDVQYYTTGRGMHQMINKHKSENNDINKWKLAHARRVANAIADNIPSSKDINGRIVFQTKGLTRDKQLLMGVLNECLPNDFPIINKDGDNITYGALAGDLKDVMTHSEDRVGVVLNGSVQTEAPSNVIDLAAFRAKREKRAHIL